MNIIHIGLPKCASTSLQQNLFSRHPDICYWGIPWQEERLENLMACMSYYDALDFANVDAAMPLQQEKPNVISYERFSSDFNADRLEVAKRLYQVFGESEILLVIRKQSDQMESLYKQYLRGVPHHRKWCTFQEYIEACYCLFHWNDPLMRARGSRGDSLDLTLDLESPLPPELHQKYDVAFNHTTLEHVYDVQTSIGNICKLSRDIVIVVVPFLQMVHWEPGSYGDYWRFTPFAMDGMLQDNGFHTLYASHNDNPLHAVYLFYVASRQPENWKDRFPPRTEFDRTNAPGTLAFRHIVKS